jgi:hypothetical protein
LQRVIAALVSDSGLRPVLAGARGPGSSRYLTYAAAEIELEVELTSPTSGQQRVVGQVLGEGGWSRAAIETSRGDRIESDIDAAGMFAFPPVSDPRILSVRGDTLEVAAELPAEEGSDR